MSQLDPSRYRKLSNPTTYGQSDGLYWDNTNSQLVMVIGNSIVARIDSSGISADPELSGEARGDIMRRGASAWEVLSAKTSGQLLVGDGTDLVSVPVSGDASLAASGALSLAESLVKYAAVSISAADIVDTAADKFGHANGYPIIASPGAGKAIELLSAVVIYDYSTAQYGAGGNISVNYAGGGSALSGAVSAANSVGAAADKIALLLPASPTNNQLVAATGVNLVSAAAFTNPGTAAGVVRVKAAYRIHTTGL